MGELLKPRIVVSAVNFTEGGPLSILQDALRTLASDFSDTHEIVALVHDRSLFKHEPVTYLEFPRVKSSWLRRVWFEYVSCRKLSRTLDADLWLALHDMTPSVTARRRAVYCHNPAPFDRLRLHDLIRQRKHAAFVLLYRFLYRINILRNDFVIVQQQWLRREFQRLYKHPRIVVAHPATPALQIPAKTSQSADIQFFYPALPRPFKNIEILIDAMRNLRRRGVSGFQISLTIDGSESPYAARLRASAADLPEIQWLGRISREHVLRVYSETDCLLFPSLLETWGMPLTEFKQTGRPILAADLPYAHETIGSYDAVRFFPPRNASALADLMAQLIGNTLRFDSVHEPNPAQPFAPNWNALFDLLLASETLPHN